MTDGQAVLQVRPERLRRWCLVAAGLVLVMGTVAAVLLRTVPDGHPFHLSDQVAVFLLGVLIAAGIMVVARPRVRADAGGLWVRNILGSHTVGWDLVAAVRFEDKSWWATLEFADGDVLALLAVQAIDGDRAAEATTTLRTLHARATAGHPRPSS